MTLGELISLLGQADQDLILPDGFTYPHSYRGIYADVAFEPAADVKVSDMLAAAKSAVGAVFQGYKGGDYLMNESTIAHISPWGQSTEEDDISPRLLKNMLARGYKHAADRPTDEIIVDEVRITPVTYYVSMLPGDWEDSPYLWTAVVDYKGNGLWTVTWGSTATLNRNGTLDPHGSGKEWVKDHTFTLSEALSKAQDLAKNQRSNTQFGAFTAEEIMTKKARGGL